MSDGIQAWLGLPDTRLVDLAVQPGGAWLWSDDAARLIWANPAGAEAVGAGPVEAADPHRRQLTQLAPRLSGSTRLERLRGFGAAPGGLMTCACTRLSRADGSSAVLVVAMERPARVLPLRERLARLVAPLPTPLAAFTADGRFAGASRGAGAIFSDLDDLAAIGAEASVAEALHSGAATAEGRAGRLCLRRLGRGGEVALIARPSADFVAAAVLPPNAPPAAAIAPLTPHRVPSWRRPLRFVWHMDANGRFALGGDPFTRLIGPLTAAACGRPWVEINAALHLDPNDRLLRAVATQRTFSGIILRWPVDGSSQRLPVELSALPVCDQAGRFLGYRGFGVCLEPDALADLATRRREEALVAPRPAAAAPSDPPMDPPMPIDPPPPNVLPFRTASGEEVASLTPVENNAFNELARQLSERLDRSQVLPRAAASDATPDAVPAAAKLRAVLDAVSDAVLTVGADGRIAGANRAARALFDADDAALARLTVFDLVVPADHHGLHAALAAPGTPASCEVERRGGDDAGSPLAMTLSWIDGDTACVAFRDLAPERELAQRSDALQRQLAQASADKADLAGWTSRELREPAEVIAAFADLMIDERFGPVGNEHYLAHLRDIRSAAQRIGKTLDELRDLARIETGAFELAPIPVSLNEVVETAIAGQQVSAGRARVVIRSSLAAALPPVEADPAALRQIVSNLTAISIHLANAGGQAIVSTARTDNGRVMLRLRDTGPGLTEAELAAAIEPLRAVADTGHATLANAGVNLALTAALIEASGATLAIRSAAHSGTLIEVAFAGADSGES